MLKAKPQAGASDYAQELKGFQKKNPGEAGWFPVQLSGTLTVWWVTEARFLFSNGHMVRTVGECCGYLKDTCMQTGVERIQFIWHLWGFWLFFIRT